MKKILLFAFCASLAAEIDGPLKSEVSRMRETFASIGTFESSFDRVRTFKEDGSEFEDSGKIFYKKEPLFFRIIFPDEEIFVKGKTLYRFVPRYKEIYVSDWEGGNPLEFYLNIPDEEFDVVFSSGCRFVFLKENEKFEILLDGETGLPKEIKNENPLTVLKIILKEVKKDVLLDKNVFKMPQAKMIDLRK